MLKLYRCNFLSILDNNHMTQEFEALSFWKFYPGMRVVAWMSQIINKMMDFHKIILELVNIKST